MEEEKDFPKPAIRDRKKKHVYQSPAGTSDKCLGRWCGVDVQAPSLLLSVHLLLAGGGGKRTEAVCFSDSAYLS